MKPIKPFTQSWISGIIPPCAEESVEIMIKKPVTITLWSQREGEEPVALTAAGTLEERPDGSLLLQYQNEDKEQNTIMVGSGRVTVERHGEICYQMVFEMGQRHRGPYQTPYGTMEMTVVTHSLENAMVDGGALSVAYHLVFGGVETEQTQLRLMVQ